MGLLYKESLSANGRDTVNQSYDGYAVTPNDTLATYQAQIPAQNGAAVSGDAIFATGTGNINVVLDAAGNTAVIAVTVANSLIPVTFIQIKATSTTATGLSALFRKGG